MSLLPLLIVYEYSFAFVLNVLFNFSNESQFLRTFSGSICIITILYIYKNSYRPGKVVRIAYRNAIIIAITILLGLFLTPLLYGYENTLIRGTILSFGAKVVPSMLMGVFLVLRDDYFKKAQSWIEPFIIFVSLVLLSATLSNSTNYVSNYTIERVGIDRQTLSYMSGSLLGLNMLITLRYNEMPQLRLFRSSIWRILNLFLIPLQLLGLFAGGGRGAFIQLTILVIYILLINRSQLKVTKTFLFNIIIIVTILYIIINWLPTIPQFYSGYNRITSFFSPKGINTDVNRISLYTSAFNSFVESPIIGHGLYASSYVIGFHSHNVFLDILVDGGLILLSIVLTILFKYIKYGFVLYKHDLSIQIIQVFFISFFVMLMFSGSIFGDSAIWLCLSYVYTYHACKKQKNSIII